MFRRRLAPVVFTVTMVVTVLASSAAHAAVIVRSQPGNGSLATAQPVTLDPSMMLRQKPGNTSLATAQPVSPTFVAREVKGHLTKTQPSAFFAFPAAAGQHMHFELRATQPTKHHTELLLYDQDRNLVALANGNGGNGSDSVVDYTIPDGQASTWIAEVRGSSSDVVSKQFYAYDLRISPASLTTVVRGTHTFTTAQDVSNCFAISVNEGDHLRVAVAAKVPDRQFPELLLYDKNGNLVAIANGNGVNGSDSIINFTIPGGEAGAWIAQVVASFSLPKPERFPFTLTITGATGVGPVIPK